MLTRGMIDEMRKGVKALLWPQEDSSKQPTEHSDGLTQEELEWWMEGDF